MRKELPIDDLPNLRLELLGLASGHGEHKQAIGVSLFHGEPQMLHIETNKTQQQAD